MNIEEKRNLGLKSTVGGVEIEPLNNEKIFRNLGFEFVNCYFVTVKNIKKML